jgi:hypothetical protein
VKGAGRVEVKRRREKLTCELNIIGVFFVVANATILKSHVIWPKLYVT